MKTIKSLFFFLILVSLLTTSIHTTTKTKKETQTFTLKTAVAYALSHNPLVERTKIDREKAELMLDEVRAKTIVPEFSLSGETGIVPEARGDIFYSPDKQTDLDGWGPFVKLNIKLVQPLLTFGRISSARTAARNAVNLEHIKTGSQVEKLTLTVITAYWAFSAAKQAEEVAADVKENYDKLIEEVKKRLRDEDSEVDDTDLLEVESNRYYIEEIVIKSKSEKNLAEKAFNAAIGRSLMASVEVTEEKIPQLEVEENQVARALRRALTWNRDLKSLETVSRALHAKTRLAYNKKKPAIVLVGGFGYGYAPHRDDQTNPFAVDHFNYMDLGAFIGFQWDLNFFRKNTEAARYKLEQKAIEQNIKLLQANVELQILTAFAEVDKNARLLEQAGKSLKAAKNWLRLSLDNWDMGIGEVERLIKAYNAYYQLKGIEIKRTLELNVSLANFAYILGNIRLYLEWVNHGKVKI
jgi:outer membrane protein TolC